MAKKIKYNYNFSFIYKVFFIAWFLLCNNIIFCQINKPITPKITKNKPTSLVNKTQQKSNKSIPKEKPKTLIFLENSELIRFDNEINPDIQVLKGNVVFRHDSVYLYCDSAYMNQRLNSFDAFGHIKIEQGDSLDIYSNKLTYNGNTRIAKLFEDVRLLNGDVTLYTDTLTYDRNINLAYYLSGGVIKDPSNKLVSKHGYYNANTKLAEFKLDVVGSNSKNSLRCDTLTYNTSSNIATILGPTTIIHADSTIVYSEKGWYDYNTDQSELLKESVIRHNNNKSLEGDTIFYDKRAGIGKAFNNVILTDSTNSVALYGNYGYYIEKGEIGMMTDSAMMTEYSQKDTIYVHGDTIFSFAVNDSDKVALVYNNVRVFQNEYQGVCDSLIFSSTDSILHLMELPILWTKDQQISGDSIHVYPKSNTVNKIRIVDNAIMIQQEDSLHYNQVSGKEIVAHIKDEQLDSVEVLGNAESIFYPTDDGDMIGMNKMESSYMTIFFQYGQLNKINIFPSPKATMYPMANIKDNMLYLKNFTWQIETRPKDKYDIFNIPNKITLEEIEQKKQELKEQEQEDRKNKRKNRNKHLNDEQ